MSCLSVHDDDDDDDDDDKLDIDEHKTLERLTVR